jgi:Cu/Ag efflux protein CusF
MTRRCAAAAVLVLSLFLLADAQPQDVSRGTIKKIDTDRKIVTLTVDGKDRDFAVTDTSRFMGANAPLKDGLAAPELKAGADVMFKFVQQGGKDVLVGMRLGNPPAAKGKKQDPPPKIDLAAFKPLTELGNGEYKGFKGGLYLDGKNERPAKHEAAGVAIAKKIQPLAADGKAVARREQQLRSQRAAIEVSRLTKELAESDQKKAEKAFEKGIIEANDVRISELRSMLASANLQLEIEKLKSLALAQDGKIVLLTIGMSNTTQVSSVFKKLADADKDKNPNVVIVDGAQGGMTAARTHKVDSDGGQKYWAEVDRRLKVAGVTREQVQVAWIKQANAGPSEGFPDYAKKLQEQLGDIVRLMQTRFPNLKIVYLSSRTFAGYATTRLNPEPYAYESGFSVRWLIEQQLRGEGNLNYDPANGKVTAPWLSWGPYLWANGKTKRADGFFYEATDFSPKDGTHPSASGQRKCAELLLQFLKSDTTARPWFVRQ